MVRTVWFLVKLGLFIALAVWLADQVGSVSVQWMGYDIQVHIGLFVAALLVLILSSIFIYTMITTFVKFPASWRRYREVRALENGYKAVTLGLTAVAAGDTKAAGRQAKLAKKFMPDDTGLPLLLEAQAARLEGREDDAQASFAVMLEHKDTAFLGVRGLLQSTMDQQDYPRALRIAEGALKTHPKQPWILQIVYDLEIKNENWDAALGVLKRLDKIGAIEKTQVELDRATLFLAQGVEAEERGSNGGEAIAIYKKALKLRMAFLPAAIQLAELYKSEKKVRAAKALIEKIWAHTPHPDLAKIWMDLAHAEKRIAAAERLIKINPEDVESYLNAAREAVEQKLWGQARDMLAQGLEIAPDVRLYEMKMRLEILAGDYETAERVREHHMVTASPAPQWICSETGRGYSTWHWFAAPEQIFGTMIWGKPQEPNYEAPLALHSDDTPASLTNGKTAPS